MKKIAIIAIACVSYIISNAQCDTVRKKIDELGGNIYIYKPIAVFTDDKKYMLGFGFGQIDDIATLLISVEDKSKYINISNSTVEIHFINTGVEKIQSSLQDADMEGVTYVISSDYVDTDKGKIIKKLKGDMIDYIQIGQVIFTLTDEERVHVKRVCNCLLQNYTTTNTL